MKLFHEPVKEKLGDFKEVLEEIIGETFFWFMFGFLFIGIIAFSNNIVGFVALIIYLAGYGWHISNKISKAKFIFDRPELSEMHKRRNKLEVELREHMLDPKGDTILPINEKLTEMVALDLNIENYN